VKNKEIEILINQLSIILSMDSWLKNMEQTLIYGQVRVESKNPQHRVHLNL
jgi:hypothetical protein